MPWAPIPVWTKRSTVKVAVLMTQTPLRSMSATRKKRPSGDSRTSWGMAVTPGSACALGPPILMASACEVPPGVTAGLRSMAALTAVALASRSSSWPLNSQLATSRVNSAVQSAWFRPAHGTGRDRCRAMVCGSRTSMRRRPAVVASAPPQARSADASRDRRCRPTPGSLPVEVLRDLLDGRFPASSSPARQTCCDRRLSRHRTSVPAHGQPCDGSHRRHDRLWSSRGPVARRKEAPRHPGDCGRGDPPGWDAGGCNQGEDHPGSDPPVVPDDEVPPERPETAAGGPEPVLG